MRWIVSFWLIALSLTAKPLDIQVHARSALLMNADTGAVLYEKCAHTPCFPASTTKIATALYLLDQTQPTLDQMIKVTAEAMKHKSTPSAKNAEPYLLETDGTMMGLVRGEILPFDSLLHGLLMVSGNDAANVLAEMAEGSVSQFMEKLNLYLKKLGVKNTQFRNPHGLHHPEHYSTAYDMGCITRKALSFPKFREVVSKISYVRPKTNKQPVKELRQANPLIKPGRFQYAKAIGVKTGFHSNAGYNLVGAAEHEGRTLIAVVFGCKTREHRCEDVVRLFEAAFAESMQEQSLLGPEAVFTQKVQGATTHLEASLKEELRISFYPAEEPAYRAFIHWEIPSLPIQKGQKVGRVEIVSSEGALLTQGDLFSQKEMKATFWFWLKSLLQ